MKNYSEIIYKDKNNNEYKEKDILVFYKKDDSASGESCKIISINSEFVELEWIDGQITIEPLKNLCDFFKINTTQK